MKTVKIIAAGFWPSSECVKGDICVRELAEGGFVVESWDGSELHSLCESPLATEAEAVETAQDCLAQCGDGDSSELDAYGRMLRPFGTETEYAYRLSGTRDELGRDEAVRRAVQVLRGCAAGAEIVVERRPWHGLRWDVWRRFAVHSDGGVARIGR